MAKLRPGASRNQGRTPTWAAGELAELYAAHRLSLVRLAMLLVDDLASAEDVVQDAFPGLSARRRRRAGSHVPGTGRATSSGCWRKTPRRCWSVRWSSVTGRRSRSTVPTCAGCSPTGGP